MKLKDRLPSKKNNPKKTKATKEKAKAPKEPAHEMVYDFTSGFGAAINADLSSGPAISTGSTTENNFEVSVRNEEPIIRRLDTGKTVPFWRKDLQVNLASACIVTIMLCLLLTGAELPEMIPFALPCFFVHLIFAITGSLDSDKAKRIRLYAAIGLGVLLIAALIIFRKYIGNGWALIMNSLYDEGEMAQAYIYDRFPVGTTGDEHPYRSMHFALIWGSSLLGLLTALPPARFRRPVALVLAAFTMLAFAYYGLIPSWICIAVLAAGLLFTLSRGSLLSTAAILLAGAIVFGAIILIDPGENYGISRVDENFRDRFALKSSYLEGNDPYYEDYTDMEEELAREEAESTENQEPGFIEENRSMVIIIVVLVILAAIGAGVWLFIRSLRKRQAANRAGIDSKDPREAIVAMFPYTVRWLQPAGIEAAGKPFASLIPVISADISERYADKYAGMYDLWKEAAYSDHDMTEADRNEMDGFMKDTVNMVKEKSNFKAKLINTIKYAL